MTAPHDDLDDAYLWDPATPPSAEVQTVERQLEPLRFEPETTPLDWTRAGAVVARRPCWTWPAARWRRGDGRGRPAAPGPSTKRPPAHPDRSRWARRSRCRPRVA